MVNFLLGLLIFIILFFIGMFNYRSYKKTADELVRKYIEERDEIKKEDSLCASIDETLPNP